MRISFDSLLFLSNFHCLFFHLDERWSRQEYDEIALLQNIVFLPNLGHVLYFDELGNHEKNIIQTSIILVQNIY